MKYKRILHTLAIAIILSLLVVAMPASLTYAATGDEYIDISPTSDEVGEYVYVDGEDFEPSTITPAYDSAVDIYFALEEASVGDRIGFGQEVETYWKVKSAVDVDGSGEFDNARFSVPEEVDHEDVHGGTYYIYVTYDGSDRIRAVDEFTVIAGEISLDISQGLVGAEVDITGENFAEDEEITVEYDGSTLAIESGNTETDSDGGFTCTIIIPESIAEDHTITVSDESGSEAEAEFTVESEITISPTSGSSATSVTVIGTGFKASRSITISFGGTVVDTTSVCETDSVGSFTSAFTVPSRISGTYQVRASDGTNNPPASFSIATNATLSPITGNVGTTLTISGTGFVTGGTVTIKYDDAEVKTTAADANGAFSATFEAPVSGSGARTILVSDGTNTKQLTFTMESTAPPTPQPLLPLMGAKAQAKTYFDWEDVTDDSLPVTYTLQVSSDKNFSIIVLEKAGLTTSEYTLTEGEKLLSTSKEAPYYWRVKAVDGASNVSGWTGVGSFYVGFSFALTGWVLYLLIGVGGLLLLGLGYWLGKRTAY